MLTSHSTIAPVRTPTRPGGRKPSPAAVSLCGTSPATRRMRARLLSLPFPAFALVVSQLLRRLDYEGVTLRGVTGSKGRNSYGGLDIEATLQRGLTRSRVICQLRQYDTEPVPRQSVDVLRGAMLRTGADLGLLITTSGFSPSAVEAAQAAQHVAPVRLIDGNELAMLLIQHNLLCEGSEGNPILPGPTTEQDVVKPGVRAVPLAAPQGGEQPPAKAAAAPPLPFPKADRRGIAITIVFSPVGSGSPDKHGTSTGREVRP